MPDRLTLTVAEVCEATSLPRRTVQSLCARGEIPAVKLGRQWMVDAEQFTALVHTRKPLAQEPVTVHDRRFPRPEVRPLQLGRRKGVAL